MSRYTPEQLKERRQQAAYIHSVIADNIRRERVALGLTQRDAAALFGAGESYFRAIENGHKQLSLLRVVEIADVLGVSAAKLLEGL